MTDLKLHPQGFSFMSPAIDAQEFIEDLRDHQSVLKPLKLGDTVLVRQNYPFFADEPTRAVTLTTQEMVDEFNRNEGIK